MLRLDQSRNDWLRFNNDDNDQRMSGNLKSYHHRQSFFAKACSDRECGCPHLAASPPTSGRFFFQALECCPMTPTRSQILCAVTLSAIGTLGLFCTSRKQIAKPKQTETASVIQQQAWASPDPTPNDGRDYRAVLAKLEAERAKLGLRYQQSAGAAERAEVVAQARSIVTESIFKEIFPAWYGTPWDFYGTTEVPQQGKIACGYFVSTVLRDAGWRVQRVRLAQQASENIVL